MNGTLEVEHILKEAALRTPGLRAELEKLSREVGWSLDSRQADGSLCVPLARWAQVAGVYADEGFPGLADLVSSEENARFVIGLLEEIKSTEAVDAMVGLFGDVLERPETQLDVAHRLVVAINLLFSFKGSPEISKEQRSALAAFLNRALALARTNGERARVMYATRGVGDERSLDVLASASDTEAPFGGARAMAIRAIRKRLNEPAAQPVAGADA